MGIPANMELIASSLGLAICRPAALLTGGVEGCSPNARIGYGSAEIKVPVGPEAVPEAASIDAEMGPPVDGQIGVLLYTEAGAPVAAQLIFPGVLFDGSGASGQSLDTSVPLIPTLPGAADISMVSMNLSLGPDRLTYYEQVRGKTVGYRPEGISLPTSCPRGGFRFTSDISFLDGTHGAGGEHGAVPVGAAALAERRNACPADSPRSRRRRARRGRPPSRRPPPAECRPPGRSSPR